MSNILESMRLGIDTEPTGLQAAARLMGERQEKIAELVLAAVTAAGQMKILEDIVWERRDYDLIHDSIVARKELLKAIQELGQ